MKVNGTNLAEKVFESLETKTKTLKNKNITPRLAIIQIGNDEASSVYVNIKKKVGMRLKAKIDTFHLSSSSTSYKLVNLVKKLNKDINIHGIIIQRPLPFIIDKNSLDEMVSPQKDVDGFHPQSIFSPPIVLAVMEILAFIHKSSEITINNFSSWLKSFKTLVIGRGETGGSPIIKYFKKMDYPVLVSNSKTKDLHSIIQKAKIIISCVGKPNIVRHQWINKNHILIGIGLHHDNNGKLILDYDITEIEKKACFYTSVPGGVGPVNVAFLFKNLLDAADISRQR